MLRDVNGVDTGRDCLKARRRARTPKLLLAFKENIANSLSACVPDIW